MWYVCNGRQLHKHPVLTCAKFKVIIPGNVLFLEAGDCTLLVYLKESCEHALSDDYDIKKMISVLFIELWGWKCLVFRSFEVKFALFPLFFLCSKSQSHIQYCKFPHLFIKFRIAASHWGIDVHVKLLIHGTLVWAVNIAASLVTSHNFIVQSIFNVNWEYIHRVIARKFCI